MCSQDQAWACIYGLFSEVLHITEVLTLIEESAVVERILRPLGLWHVPARAQRAPPPAASAITLDYRVADDPASYD